MVMCVIKKSMPVSEPCQRKGVKDALVVEELLREDAICTEINDATTC